MDGLTDLSGVPKDLVFDARSIFSDSGEQVSISCKKREMKIEFRLLCDILEKSIFVKGGSFDAVTHEHFLLMAGIIGGVKINWGRLLFNIFKEMVTVGSRQAKGFAIQICVLLKNVPALELGNSKAFPSPRILTDKTVHRYVVINDKVSVEEVANKPRVKRTPVKKAVARKRPATAEVVEPAVSKKKRTKFGKADKGSALITVAQEAVPLQIVESTPTAPAEQPPVPKRKSKKRRLRLPKGSDDEIDTERGAVEEVVENISEEQREATSAALVVEEKIVGGLTEKASEPTVENEQVVESTVDEVQNMSADDVDLIIEQASEPTVENEQVVESTVDEVQNMSADDVDLIIEQVIAETAQIWFNLSYEELIAQEADRSVVTASDTDEEMETVDFGIEPEFEIAKDQGTDIAYVVLAIVEEKLTGDESMSLEEIFLTIPSDFQLPSALGEITKIQLGKSISIPGVNEGDWYKASLPKIPVDAKGKAPLEIVDPVQGNPAKEQFSLICEDIEVLVQLREKVIDEVEKFFNSFSFKKLAVLKIEDFYAKEEKVLTWAETDSTREALQRRMYILTKYRELLIIKFLEAYKSNFVPGEGSSATDLKVLDMLSNLHLFLLEELKILIQAHGLTWDMTCCSKLLEGRKRDRGAVISGSNPNIRSSCWIRTMVLVNGSWVIEPCADYWKPLPKPVVCTEISHRISYVDTLPPISEFFKVMKKRWADVCIEAAKFFVSGKLLPIGSLNFCRTIAVVEPPPVFGSRRPTVTYWGWSQLCTVFARYCLFGGLSTVDIRNFVSNIAADRSVLRDIQLGTFSASVIPPVQSVASSVFVDQNVQLFLDQRPHSPSTSADSSMHFVEDDTLLGDDAASNQLSPPVFSADFSINKLEKDILAALHQHEEANRSMIQNVRQEARTQSDALLLCESRGEPSKPFYPAWLPGCYINRGGDAKKGEGGSSRPQPPPDDQERPSGGSTGRGSSGGDGSQRRSDRGGSSKKRHRSTGGSGSGSGSSRVTYGPYLPPKRDAEYWIYGKRQF
ncbi:hypothetical protein F511_05109 [Dorcoceras hygrometricum]|uniref:Splicing factor 3B subunit 1-like n=1 Tax=Dorcoceras hygrometricum TaxID=472368 RepID=A0A2Z7ALS0_9LAMI|nr:hypothetical protein F511_05109 [Dorcoceras hygrometricum]